MRLWDRRCRMKASEVVIVNLILMIVMSMLITMEPQIAFQLIAIAAATISMLVHVISTIWCCGHRGSWTILESSLLGVACIGSVVTAGALTAVWLLVLVPAFIPTMIVMAFNQPCLSRCLLCVGLAQMCAAFLARSQALDRTLWRGKVNYLAHISAFISSLSTAFIASELIGRL